MLVVPGLMVGIAHHTQHLRASGAKEADGEHCCKEEKHDVEHGRVVPVDRLLHNQSFPFMRNEMENAEYGFHGQSSGGHRDVKATSRNALIPAP